MKNLIAYMLAGLIVANAINSQEAYCGRKPQPFWGYVATIPLWPLALAVSVFTFERVLGCKAKVTP